jgi:hypothetical protein
VDPLFISTASEAEIGEALHMWPELAGRRIRPLLVSAFGEIFVETDVGDVWAADPVEMVCQPVAPSFAALEALFADPEWAQERLMTEVLLLARDKGIERPQHQVFSIAPHPSFTGSVMAGTLMPMDLKTWHYIVSQIREQTAQPQG